MNPRSTDVSFEFFPPNTPEGLHKLRDARRQPTEVPPREQQRADARLALGELAAAPCALALSTAASAASAAAVAASLAALAAAL
jgi:5,10-methylenetetrahydrofolate reductase